MSKFARRALAILIAAMMLLPAAALATSETGVPVGDEQIEYVANGDYSIAGSGDIASISMSPSQNGNMVYPNVYVTFEGTAPIYYTITLQRKVNGAWQDYSAVSGSGLYTTSAMINPGYSVTSGVTYRFVADVFSASSALLTGNSFTAR